MDDIKKWGPGDHCRLLIEVYPCRIQVNGCRWRSMVRRYQ